MNFCSRGPSLSQCSRAPVNGLLRVLHSAVLAMGEAGAGVLAVSVENALIQTAWDTVAVVVVAGVSPAGEVVDFQDVAAEGVEQGGVVPAEEGAEVVGALDTPLASL